MGREDRIAPAAEVEVERRGHVAVLRLLTAPTGALTRELRRDILLTINQLAADDDVRAIVLTGAMGVFAVGTSLETGDELGDDPDLAAVCDRIEALKIPCIAAISGAALGNGLELALAAHYRVVSPSARLGAPEITIGLVPNAGGTQRLPKVVGGVAALKILLSGRAVNGVSAGKLGLADRVVDTDILEAAVAFADEVIASVSELPRNSTRRDRLGEGGPFLEAVSQHKAVAARSGLDAPLRLIECVEAALLLPYEIGRGLESAAFEDLVHSEHSRSLRHVFAAERRLQARTAETGRVPSRPLNSAAVLAARGLGNEVAVAALDAGFKVSVAERTDEALEAGVTRVIEHYDARVAAGRMTEDAVEATLDRMNAVCGYRTLGNVDIVIDPGPSIARERVAEIDAVLKAGAIFATGSDHVDLARIAQSTGRPADVVGFKMYPGLLKNRIVELSVLKETSPKARETARAFARKIGRLIVETGAGGKGIGAQVTDALHAAADAAVLDGASIAQVDAALRDWGLPYGSFAWRDAQGLERALKDRSAGEVDSRLAANGRTGRKVGRGFYSYARRGAPGVEDPLVAQLIQTMRAERGIKPRKPSDGEVRLACVAAMAGAGARMLMEGTALRPSDIDMVAVHGLGFARRTGGVMFAADLIGLERIRDVLARLSERERRVPKPSPIFDDLIRAGKGFSDLDG
ncbi:hypothetical protein GQ651_02825 [Alphaproteobacteria bacterium GH1-50]|uniref:Uncharacterized protein n=1 Tax=Kangsaoukella pontilimi TaxID=2691042 RepID=A0A7C9M8Q9_9RHOB|nr:enoyl-CoA hydratase-related protein [Kangsaoukella pontilimi]MXQ06773.1 hypothetical protein [Kangsaoukella pontilimi]